MYLYSLSLLFLLYIYIYLLRDSTAGSGLSAVAKKITILESLRRLGEKGVDNGPDGPVPPRLKKYRISDNDKSHGSLFLRIGAIGSKESEEYILTTDFSYKQTPHSIVLSEGIRIQHL